MKKRINRIKRIMSVSLAYHGKKKEFLNSFVSLIPKRINRIMFTCVCPLKPTALFKDKKIIMRLGLAKSNGSLILAILFPNEQNRTNDPRFVMWLMGRRECGAEWDSLRSRNDGRLRSDEGKKYRELNNETNA